MRIVMNRRTKDNDALDEEASDEHLGKTGKHRTEEAPDDGNCKYSNINVNENNNIKKNER